MMKEKFRQLITDFQRGEIPEPVPRDITFPELPPSVRKAFVLVGVRRSGKTWTLFERMHDLLARGIDKKQILYLNFSDERLERLQSKDLQSILDAYFELYPDLAHRSDLYFFFDEVHEVDGWEKFVRRLIDTEKMQIYVTGSSAKMLSKEIATSLRGRTITREVFPYSFREYLRHRNCLVTAAPTTKEKAMLSQMVREYLQYGGFPEAVDVSRETHRELLQGYVETVIYRDIVDRYQVRNITALKRLLNHCLKNSCKFQSINKIYRTLHSQGYSVGRDSLHQFMEYLEDAYCLFSVPNYHPSVTKVAQRPKKIYPVDQGLVTAYGWHESFRQGTRLENAVFCHLRRDSQQCHYYLTEKGREVDLLVVDDCDRIALVQVSLTLKDPQTEEREVLALKESMSALGLTSSTIVTLSDPEAELSTDEGRITITPAWKFLLP